MTFKMLILAASVLITSLTSCQAQNKKTNQQSPNKNPNKMNLTATDTSGQLMNEDDFWSLIDKSRAASKNNYEMQINSMKTILTTLEPADIIKFDNTFTALLAASYDYNLWGASYVI